MRVKYELSKFGQKTCLELIKYAFDGSFPATKTCTLLETLFREKKPKG